MTDIKTITCGLCNKSFKNKQGLEYHTEKQVCQKFSCTFCGTRFKSSLGLQYHVERRVCLPPSKIPITIVRKTTNHRYFLPRTELKLRDVMEATPDFASQVFDSDNIVVKFCELALANAKLDQYWTYYINNRREPFIMVYDDDQWSIKPQSIVFKDLTDWAMSMLNKYLEDNKQFVDIGTYYNKYLFMADMLSKDKGPVNKDVRQGLMCIFINQKGAVREKIRQLSKPQSSVHPSHPGPPTPTV